MRLIDVCKFIVDCPHSTANDEGAGYPLIRTPNVGRGRLILSGVHRVSEEVYNKRNARAVPMTNDIILAREAPAGNAAIIQPGEKVCLGQRTVLIRPDTEKVNPQYLAYYLLAPKQQNAIVNSANGATVAHVNMPKIRNLEIGLPDRKQQDITANILSAYDDAISNSYSQICLCEELIVRAYRASFLDRTTQDDTKSGNQSQLSNGWRNGKLKDIAFISGKNEKKSNREIYKYYLPIDCLPKKSLGYTNYDNIDLAESSLISFQKGDILFGAMRPYFHKVVIARDKGLTRNTCFVINAINPSYWGYLVSLLFSDESIAYATKHSVGTTMPYVRWNDFADMPTIIPPEDVVSKYGLFISPVLKKIQVLSDSIINLTSAKDYLLPLLIK